MNLPYFLIFWYIHLQSEPIKLGPSEFACPFCSKIMKKRADVHRHIRTHTSEKPFPCNFCNQYFSMKHNRDRHEHRHHLWSKNKYTDFENIFIFRVNLLRLVNMNMLVHSALKSWKLKRIWDDTFEHILEKNLLIVIFVIFIFVQYHKEIGMKEAIKNKFWKIMIMKIYSFSEWTYYNWSIWICLSILL